VNRIHTLVNRLWHSIPLAPEHEDRDSFRISPADCHRCELCQMPDEFCVCRVCEDCGKVWVRCRCGGGG